MAKIVIDENRVQDVSQSYVWWHLMVIGAGVGVVYWILANLIGHFIIDQLFCGNSSNAVACANSTDIAGNIANILVATIGLAVMVRLRVFRPIIIAAASAIMLWGLAGWMSGLSWVEVLLWPVVLFGLCYLLFSWIGRYTRSMPVLIVTIALLVIGRIVLAL